MDGGAWKAAVRGVAEGRTRLSDFTFTFHLHALEKKMATHSSILAWEIPWTEEPARLNHHHHHIPITQNPRQLTGGNYTKIGSFQ